jgi:hypothetical protein
MTTRGSAPNASDPVTRSMGERPSLPLVKCVTPSKAASIAVARSTSGCNPRRVSEFLWLSAATAETIGSMTRSPAPPAFAIASCRAGTSWEGSNGRRSAPFVIMLAIKMWSKSAPAALKRGINVSAASSSPLQIITFAASARVPSGHSPPDETMAAKVMAWVLLPTPGAPARMWTFPRASQSRHTQRMGRASIVDALSRVALQGRDSAPNGSSAAPLGLSASGS